LDNEVKPMTVGPWIWIPIVCILALAALVLVLRRSAKSPQSALSSAVQLAKAGNLSGASSVLIEALNRMPPATQCKGKTAEQRFNLLMLLSDMTRKGTADAQRELELLDECVDLVGEIPPPPPGPDALVNMAYLLFLNRGNAAVRTGRHRLAEESYRAALQAARDPGTRCKCLAYCGGAILRQEDKAKLDQAQACFDRFDQIRSAPGSTQRGAGTAVSPSLVSYVALGRAVLALYGGELAAARRACKQSIQADRSQAGAHALLKVLERPGATAADGIRFVFGGQGDGPPGAGAGMPLSPLPEHI
jgi:tetratricopeptide (TPR) repeat protein